MSRRRGVPGVRLAAGAWRPQSVTEMPAAPATPVAPVARHWQAVGDPPAADDRGLGERLRAAQRPIALGSGPAPGAQPRQQVRESPDGVLAIRDRRRTGRPGSPWLVIDVPPGHRGHWRDQALSDLAVRDWVALVRAADQRADPRHADLHDDDSYRATDPAPRLGTWPRTEQP